MKSIDHHYNIEDLRFGFVTELYYAYTGEKLPSQLALLDTWFPSLFMTLTESEEKIPAEFDERFFMIKAVRYKGKLYAGGSRDISQLLGRLIGTAKGSQEKQRKNAELLRMHVSGFLVTDMDAMEKILENNDALLRNIPDEKITDFAEDLIDSLFYLAEKREKMTPEDKLHEPQPMYDETFDNILYNAGYQLHLNTWKGLVKAWTWLLIGSLLRNESGRVTRYFDTGFVPAGRQQSENNTISDKLNFLFFPEQYESVYYGDMHGEKYPGIEWTCDKCGAHLNDQEGFTDQKGTWQCTNCGYINKISMDEIYDSEEDYKNGIGKVNKEDMERAIKERKEEIRKQEEKGKNENRNNKDHS